MAFNRNNDNAKLKQIEEENYRRVFLAAETRLANQRGLGDYAYDFEATNIFLAFVDNKKRRKSGKMGRWETLQNDVTGRFIHVELWWQFNKKKYGVACSAVGATYNKETKEMEDPGGVFFNTRCFSNPDYVFFRLGLSEQESDEMICFCYNQRGKHFNTAGMWLSWVPNWLAYIPRCCLGIRRRRVDANYERIGEGNDTWFCSELVFTALKRAGVLERIIGVTQEFIERDARNIKPDHICDALLQCNAITATFNQAKGINPPTEQVNITISGTAMYADFADDSSNESMFM